MMQCVAAGHQIVALANLRPAESTGRKALILMFVRLFVFLFFFSLIKSNRCTTVPILGSFLYMYLY